MVIKPTVIAKLVKNKQKKVGQKNNVVKINCIHRKERNVLNGILKMVFNQQNMALDYNLVTAV